MSKDLCSDLCALGLSNGTLTSNESSRTAVSIDATRAVTASPSLRSEVYTEFTSAGLWSTLPTELVLEILTHVAIDAPIAAGHLRRVCSDWNRFILPIILQHVVLNTANEALRYSKIIHAWQDVSCPVLGNPWGAPLPKPSTKQSGFPRSVLCAQTLALVTPTQRPSVENALAGVKTLANIHSLAISVGNVTAHRFWLRRQHVRPRRIMLLHHGKPIEIECYHDELFSRVTHLYAHEPRTLTGSHHLGYSRRQPWSDCLSHVAIHTVLKNMTDEQRQKVADGLRWALDGLPSIKHLALTVVPSIRDLTRESHIRPNRLPKYAFQSTEEEIMIPGDVPSALQPQAYWDDIFPELSALSPYLKSGNLHRESRFTPMLYPLDARREWLANVDVWERANLWRRAQNATVDPQLYATLWSDHRMAWGHSPDGYHTTEKSGSAERVPTTPPREWGRPGSQWLLDATENKHALIRAQEAMEWVPVDVPW